MNRRFELAHPRHRRAQASPWHRGGVVEPLEGRRLFDASALLAPVEPVQHGDAAVVMARAKALAASVGGVPQAVAGPYVKSSAVVAALAARVNPTRPSTEPLFVRQDLYGLWTGTFVSAKNSATTPLPLSVDFYRRQAVARTSLTQAFTGAFNLSAMTGEARAVTTVTMSRQVDVRISIITSTATTSFSGAVSLNGKVIAGRYAVLINGQYEVGTFTLTKQPAAPSL